MMLTITQEKISESYTCQNCAKTFAGDQALMNASSHARITRHTILGKSQYLVEIKP